MATSTLMHPAIAGTAASTRTVDISRQQSHVLLTAFSLSTTHTVYAHVMGLASPDFTITMPTTWAFYAVGFGLAALARRSELRIQRLVVGLLALLVGVGVFLYPTTFTPEQQTVFGWFENDVYVALLVLGLYLGIQRLRGVSLRPVSDGH